MARAETALPNSEYTKERHEYVCGRLFKSDTQADICADLGVDPNVIWRWRQKYPQFDAEVTAAMVFRGESYADRADKVLEDLPLDADTAAVSRARELANQYRWRASKAMPAHYGDRTQHDVTVTHSYVDDLGKLENVIDHEPVLLARAGGQG